MCRHRRSAPTGENGAAENRRDAERRRETTRYGVHTPWEGRRKSSPRARFDTRRAASAPVSAFGLIVALAGFVRGDGAALEGGVSPESILVESWPNSSGWAIPAGVPGDDPPEPVTARSLDADSGSSEASISAHAGVAER